VPAERVHVAALLLGESLKMLKHKQDIRAQKTMEQYVVKCRRAAVASAVESAKYIEERGKKTNSLD
jgi:hypothetical protein